MPALPPDLQPEVVTFCRPIFLEPDHRLTRLRAVCGAWEGVYDLILSGSAQTVTTEVIRQLSPDLLISLVRSRQVELGGREAEIDALCQRIERADLTLSTGDPTPFTTLYQQIINKWSRPEYQVDRRFVQLTLLLDQGPDAPQRFIPDSQHNRYDALHTLLAEHPHESAFILLGAPGSGKTTLLRRLALELSWTALDDHTPEHQTDESAPPVIPFFVMLNSYRSTDPDQPPPPPATWLADRWAASHPDLPPLSEIVQHYPVLLLLDGLNEMPHVDQTAYEALVKQWQDYLQNDLPHKARAVFTCRSLDYSVLLSRQDGVNVRQVRVEPLSSAQIQAFLTSYLPDEGELAGLADRVWAALRADPQQLTLLGNPFFLRLLIDQVVTHPEYELPTGRAGLLTGFVRRTLRREWAWGNPLLQPAQLLLSETDTMRLQHYNWPTPYALPEEGLLLPQLAALAFGMQDGDGGKKGTGRQQVSLPYAEAQGLLPLAAQNLTKAAEIMQAGFRLNLLDRDLDDTLDVRFFHQLLQEYFAARCWAKMWDKNGAGASLTRVRVPWRASELPLDLDSLDKGDTLPALPSRGWEETARLACALAADPAAVIVLLAEHNLPLAGQCAASREVQERLPAALVSDLQQRLLARSRDSEADLRARMAAAEALGELGDPRFEKRTGAHGPYLYPPLVAIPAGTAWLGDDESRFEDEKPMCPVPLRAFEVGQFPVTNAEYRYFVESGGYEDEQWWDTPSALAWLRDEGSNEGQIAQRLDVYDALQILSEGDIRSGEFAPEQVDVYLYIKAKSRDEWEAELREMFPSGVVSDQPDYWQDSHFKGALQPVVGISWYEARAYVNWLSAQTGERFDLPTEAEWEGAVRGTTPDASRPANRQAYPYGDSFDPLKGNTFETHLQQTSPIGVFSSGDAPTGLSDVSGNVWEWTNTMWGEEVNWANFTYPYLADDGREAVAAPSTMRRVARGGSWDYNQVTARAIFRARERPDYRSHDQGFRLVRRPSSYLSYL